MHSARILIALAAAALLTSAARAQESALEAARAATRSAPYDARTAITYGRALRRAGHENESTQELRRASTLAPTGPLGIEARWELARTAIAKREFQAAMSHCRSVSALTGGAVAGHACTAEAHLLWRRGSEALVETEQALAGGTKSYEAKVAEGIARELELRDDLAEQAFREAIAWKPEAWEAHVWLGRLLVRKLKHDEGVAELRKAQELDPYGPEAAYELARTMPANAESAALLEKAAHERPTYAAALRRLAEVDMTIGRLPAARKAAEAAIKADTSDASSHLVLGRVAFAEGDADGAIKESQAALGIVPNSAPAKLLIADSYAKKGEIDLAVENYQTAYGLDHADPAPLVRASEACHVAGRETSAKAFGEKATKEFPEWAPAWVALGDALVANKEIAPARAAYDTALKSKGPLDVAAVQKKRAALK